APTTISGWCLLARAASSGGRRYGKKSGNGPVMSDASASARSALERLPHLDVALGRPDARIGIVRRFVVGAGHVERQAVVEDDPVPEPRLQRVVRLAVDGVERPSRLRARLDAAVHRADEVPRAVEA